MDKVVPRTDIVSVTSDVSRFIECVRVGVSATVEATDETELEIRASVDASEDNEVLHLYFAAAFFKAFASFLIGFRYMSKQTKPIVEKMVSSSASQKLVPVSRMRTKPSVV